MARRCSRRLPPQWDRRTRELGKALVGYGGSPRLGGRHMMFAGFRRVSQLALAPFGQAQLLVDTRDEIVGRSVFLTGGFERSRMEAALRVLASEGLNSFSERTFVDVGANIGTSTVDALVQFGMGRALCIEPELHNFRLLKMNLLLNDLDSRTIVSRSALSDHDGETVLGLSATNFGDHRVISAPNGSQAPARAVQIVPCRRLDWFVENRTVAVADVGLVWVDAQGHDPLVMAGASRFLRARTPMVVEYWPDGLQETGSLELLEKLIRRHYRTVVDVARLSMRARAGVVLQADHIRDLRGRYGKGEYTDLLLLG